MKRGSIFLVVMLLIMSLCSCSNPNNQGVGTVTGAVAGGLVGSAIGAGTGQVVAIGVGAIAGALLGNEIGKRMDESDKGKVNNAMDNNVTSQPTYWVNDKTGGKYMVVPESGFITVNGNPKCRRYASTGYVNGVKRHTHGIACKQSDGTWLVVSRK